MSFDSLLNRTGSLLHFAGAGTDDYGQPVKVWSTVETLALRIQPATGRKTEWDRLGIVATHEAFCRKPTVSLTVKDRITCEGTTFDVQYVKNAAGHEHHLELALRRVDQEDTRWN